MPSKDTKTLSVRVPNTTIELIKSKLAKRKLTINAWLIWTINQGLRKHRKR